MMNLRVGVLIMALLVSATASAVADKYWQFESDDDGITIYTHEHKNGLVEIRAQMFTPTSYGAFLTLLEDSDNIPNWVDNALHSRVLQQVSATENIVYTQFSAPWPVKNRDMVTYSNYWLDELGFTLKIKDAPESTLEEQRGYIRIHSVDATWKLQKLTNGTTFIEYKVFADPGGVLPIWLVNNLSKQSARATFSKLREQLPRYQQYSHPKINE